MALQSRFSFEIAFYRGATLNVLTHRVWCLGRLGILFRETAPHRYALNVYTRQHLSRQRSARGALRGPPRPKPCAVNKKVCCGESRGGAAARESSEKAEDFISVEEPLSARFRARGRAPIAAHDFLGTLKRTAASRAERVAPQPSAALGAQMRPGGLVRFCI